ncbi:MAG TPA: FAD-dependent oxidoreductase [Acetobacteraceae bacterium]|nr:FAD-dependent oxidoreductase [Acetobacteraceae bacterium]
MTLPVAVVGAGLAGLSCACTLAAAGHPVRLYDKGRAPGGRLATRRAEVDGVRLQFDHGAQYLTARGSAFAALLEADAVRWPAAGQGRFVGAPGMSALPRALAGGVPLLLSRHVTGLSRDAVGWHVRHVDAAAIRSGRPIAGVPATEDGPFAAVLLAVPAPQAVTLLEPLDARLARAAASADLAPCWTVMASFATRPDLPDLVRPEAGPLAWAARDSGKPGRDAATECWVLQASPTWSREHLEAEPAQAMERLLAALPLPAPRHAAAHRWRYALADRPLGEGCVWDAALRVGLCGDWCIAGRAEAAFDSGAALARAVLG